METTIESKILYKGRNFSFKTDKVKLESGSITNRDFVLHPGAVAIIAVNKSKIVLVRQYRYAAKRELLEIPAGTLEEGETPLACAIRELREETGYSASNWSHVLSCYMAPGYSTEIIHFYLAEGLTEAGQNTEEDEIISVELVEFNEALRLIEEHKIIDSKTITGILTFLTRI